MSSKLCRLALWPLSAFWRSHLITSKSSLCFYSRIQYAKRPCVPMKPFRNENIVKILCNHSSTSNEMPATGGGNLSVSDLNSSESPASLFLDLTRSSAAVQQNMEDVKRKISVRINDVEFEMKAVELYKAIRKMKTDEILSLIENCFQQLDKTHLCICLKCLYKLSMASRYEPDHRDSIQELQSDSRFQALCILVAKKGRFLEPSVAHDMVIFMAYFGIDSHHPVMKHMLQLAKHFINDLALDQLVVFANYLSEMPVTDQTRILKEAVKLLSKSRSHQVDMLTTWHKVTLLNLCGDQLPYSDKLLFDIWKERESLSASNSVRLLTALSFLVARHRLLETWSLQTVEMGLNSLTVSDVLSVAESCQRIGLCPSSLFQNIAQIEMAFEEHIRVWSILTECGWFSERLTNTIVDGLSAKRMEQLDLPFSTVVKLLCRLGDAGKTIKNIDNLQSWVHENCERIRQLLAPAELLDFCVSILLLGLRLENSLANIIFSTEFFLNNLESSSYIQETGMTNVDKLILIKGLTNILTSEDSLTSRLKETNVRLPRPDSPLFGAVNHLWSFADHRIHTESGLYADHILEFDNKTRVAILVWPKSCFWVNTMQLKSLPKLYAKRIQSDGYDVVVINSNQWRKIVDREQFDFLKCRVDEASSNKDLIIW